MSEEETTWIEDVAGITVIPKDAQGIIVTLRDGFQEFVEVTPEQEEEIESLEDALKKAFPGLNIVIVQGTNAEVVS